jgi:acyl phosphate:glycerol-3-phosphate acyltransferase
MRPTLIRSLHVLALGTWFGGAAFFNFVAAPAIFESFKEVVNGSPSDRTAFETIISSDATPERKNALASALAGAAVGPVFPKYFAMQAICGLIALFTAMTWFNAEGGRKVHRLRVFLIGTGLLLVIAGWPLSELVSDLRLQRFDPNTATAAAAKDAFAVWHLVSLLLSFVTVVLAGIALAMAAKLPAEDRRSPTAVGG